MAFRARAKQWQKRSSISDYFNRMLVRTRDGKIREVDRYGQVVINCDQQQQNAPNKDGKLRQLDRYGEVVINCSQQQQNNKQGWNQSHQRKHKHVSVATSCEELK
jgi:S-adenosylmethionine hydrolase